MYDVLVPLQRIMDQGSLGDDRRLPRRPFAPLLVLVHELGHALAVKARGLPLRALKVGDRTDLIVSVGRSDRAWAPRRSDMGGYVMYDGRG